MRGKAALYAGGLRIWEKAYERYKRKVLERADTIREMYQNYLSKLTILF